MNERLQKSQPDTRGGYRRDDEPDGNTMNDIRHPSHSPVSIRNAIYAMVNALGAALPRTPEVVAALNALVESDREST